MEAYTLLEKVIENNTSYDLYYFDDETDAVNTLGGRIICGNVDAGNYLVANDEPFDDETCEAVMYHYRDTQYLYRIDDL